MLKVKLETRYRRKKSLSCKQISSFTFVYKYCKVQKESSFDKMICGKQDILIQYVYYNFINKTNSNCKLQKEKLNNTS